MPEEAIVEIVPSHRIFPQPLALKETILQMLIMNNDVRPLQPATRRLEAFVFTTSTSSRTAGFAR